MFWKVFVYHLQPVHVPLLVSVPQVGKRYSTGWLRSKTYTTTSINVISLGQTISDDNKWMITLTEFPFPLNQRLSLYVISFIGVMSLQIIIEKYYEFLLKKKPIKILNVPLRPSIDGIFIPLYFCIGSSNRQIR